jgi:hypothetical protein
MHTGQFGFRPNTAPPPGEHCNCDLRRPLPPTSAIPRVRCRVPCGKLRGIDSSSSSYTEHSQMKCFYLRLGIGWLSLRWGAAQEAPCADLRLLFVLAERPADIALSLQQQTTTSSSANNNSAVVYWGDDHRPYASSNSVMGATVIQEICLPSDDCYLLRIVDTAQGSASTPTTSLAVRAYSISYGNNLLGFYDSTAADSYCFAEQWYQFGNRCFDDTNTSQWSVYHETVPCSNTTSSDQEQSSSSNTTDILILKDQNETQTSPDVSLPPPLMEPSSVPTVFLFSPPVSMTSIKLSQIPSVAPLTTPSKAPSVAPSAFTLPLPPSVTPSRAPDGGPISLHSVDDVLHDALSSIPSDWPSALPSAVPTPDCVVFAMDLERADEAPEDMILTLVATRDFGTADDVLLWDHVRPWAATTNSTGNSTSQTTCLSRGNCYTFYVEDARADGLTAGNVSGGYYTLSLDDRILAYYDAQVHGCYARNIYQFGTDDSVNCSFVERTEPSDRSCPQIRKRRR